MKNTSIIVRDVTGQIEGGSSLWKNDKKKDSMQRSSKIIDYLECLLSKLSGRCLVQLSDEPFPAFENHSFSERFWVSSAFQDRSAYSETPDIYSAYHELPFEPDSIDLILTSYLDDYEKRSQSILQECFRVLKPNSYLCILGKATHSAPSVRSSIKRLYYFFVLCQDLYQAGGTIIDHQHFFDTSWLNKQSIPYLYTGLEKLFIYTLPSQLNVYLILAKKNVLRVNPLKPSFQSFARVITKGKIIPC